MGAVLVALLQAIMILLAACLLFMLRVDLIYRIRKRELDRVHAVLVDMITMRHAPGERIQAVHQAYDFGPSYLRQLLDLRKWTYPQFYPNKNDRNL